MKVTSKVKEQRKLTAKGWEDKKKRPQYKAFKSKVEGLKDAVFKSGFFKHAVQFAKTIDENADYIQIKYNSDMARMIRDVERPVFKFRQQPTAQIITNANGNPI